MPHDKSLGQKLDRKLSHCLQCQITPWPMLFPGIRWPVQVVGPQACDLHRAQAQFNALLSWSRILSDFWTRAPCSHFGPDPANYVASPILRCELCKVTRCLPVVRVSQVHKDSKSAVWKGHRTKSPVQAGFESTYNVHMPLSLSYLTFKMKEVIPYLRRSWGKELICYKTHREDSRL
jgi:hypothetical protein